MPFSLSPQNTVFWVFKSQLLLILVSLQMKLGCYGSPKEENEGLKIGDVMLTGFPGGTSGKEPACQ